MGKVGYNRTNRKAKRRWIRKNSNGFDDRKKPNPNNHRWEVHRRKTWERGTQNSAIDFVLTGLTDGEYKEKVKSLQGRLSLFFPVKMAKTVTETTEQPWMSAEIRQEIKERKRTNRERRNTSKDKEKDRLKRLYTQQKYKVQQETYRIKEKKDRH